MSDFLPKNAPEIPTGESLYMKLSEKENRFRVMGSAIVGFELWVNGKPKRNKQANEFTSEDLENADTNRFTNKKKTPQYFWAFPVFNYQTKRVEILEITQITVMRGIDDYLQDEDYGKDPKKYDLVVTRDEPGDRVEYRVKAKPPKEIDEGIAQMYKDTDIDLEALYRSDNPFEKKEEDLAEDAVKAGL